MSLNGSKNDVDYANIFTLSPKSRFSELLCGFLTITATFITLS